MHPAHFVNLIALIYVIGELYLAGLEDPLFNIIISMDMFNNLLLLSISVILNVIAKYRYSAELYGKKYYIFTSLFLSQSWFIVFHTLIFAMSYGFVITCIMLPRYKETNFYMLLSIICKYCIFTITSLYIINNSVKSDNQERPFVYGSLANDLV